jgi:hypothetical protein
MQGDEFKKKLILKKRTAVVAMLVIMFGATCFGAAAAKTSKKPAKAAKPAVILKEDCAKEKGFCFDIADAAAENAGQTVILPVTVRNAPAPGVAAGAAGFTYDPKVLSLEKIVWSKGITFHQEKTDQPGAIALNFICDAKIGEGLFFSLEFKVLGATAKTTNVTWNPDYNKTNFTLDNLELVKEKVPVLKNGIVALKK